MTLLSLSLFFGGTAILFTKVAGWSLLLALIIIPTGFVLTIFTLDDVARSFIVPPAFKATKCHVCGRSTYVREDEKDVICAFCRKDIGEEIEKEGLKS